MPTEMLSIDDTAIAFDQAGAGEAVLLLHAGIADRSMWDAQMESLSANHNVIRIDFRGFGDSLRTTTPFTNAGDVVAVMDALGLEEVHLVGVSMGSRVAAEVAAMHPDRLTSLTLVSTMLGCGTPPESMFALWREVTDLLEAREFEAANELEMNLWIDGPNRSPADLDQLFRRNVAAMNLALLMRSDQFESELEISPGVEDKIELFAKMPLAFIWGEEDIDLVCHASEALGNRFPGSLASSIPNASHLPNMERPEEFNAILLDFLNNGPGEKVSSGH